MAFMRVALVCPYAWDAPGGVQVHVGDLARYLRSQGHDVLVIAPAFAPAAGIVRIGRPLRVAYRGTVAPIAPWPWEVRAVRRALDGFAPDVVHIHEPFLPGASMWALRAARPNVAAVGTFHAFTENSTLLERAAPALRWAWRRLDTRIAVSSAAAGMVSGPFRPAPVVIPNGVDVAVFGGENGSPSSDRTEKSYPTVLWVNRLDPQKGFRVALKAFELLDDLVPGVRLVVAGDGPDRDALDDLPAHVRARVVMLGRVAHEALPEQFRAADVLISPAIGQESFGIVLVEAMAAGTPVIASAIPGYREVLTGALAAGLVPPGNPSALADAVAAVLTDTRRANVLASQGRLMSRDYDWSVVGMRLLSEYEGAIHRRAARGDR